MGSHRIELFAPSGIPLIEPGADLAAIIIAALRGNGEHLLPGDIVIIAQKTLAKAETGSWGSRRQPSPRRWSRRR